MDLLNEEYLLFFKYAQLHSLDYMLIGGYAVNYYGYNRNTNDLDIWLNPTNENKVLFLNVLLSMGYDQTEIDYIKNEDFTQHFVCSIGSEPFFIDVLTYVHKDIEFEKAKITRETHQLIDDVYIQIVPFDFLRDMKIRTHREKDLLDVSQLDIIKKNKFN